MDDSREAPSNDGASPNAMTVCGVCKTFRGRDRTLVRALDAVSFSTRANELTCLLGATGCGKSTLLRVCAGLESPDAGYVDVGGETPVRARRRIGYIPQQDDLLPWLTLEGNVILPLRIRHPGISPPRSTAQAALAHVGLGDRLGAYPHECSGGMRQRAMLARHIVGGADIWLLDEPFSALDEETRRDLQGLLLRLREELNLSILFVTHAVEEALTLANRILVLSIHTNQLVCNRDVNLPHPRNRIAPAFLTLADDVRAQMESQCTPPA